MARIAWTAVGSRFFEAGVDRGVLYIDSLAGIPWVGLTSIEETPTGGEPKAYYIDGIKYLNLSSEEEFEASINAYTYPVEFAECDGTARIRPGLFFGQQKRKPFGFSYRSMVGNDTSGTDHAYKIHLVYNAIATPASKTSSSINDSVEAFEFSWKISTRSRFVSGYHSTAHVIVDSRYTHPLTMEIIENILYGDEFNVARLPTPEELIDIFDIPVAFTVTDNEDGTYTFEGPDSDVTDVGLDMFVLNHESISTSDGDTYTISY